MPSPAWSRGATKRRRRGRARHDGRDERRARAPRAPRPPSSRHGTSATCSSYAACASRTCTTSSGASRRRSWSAASASRCRSAWPRTGRSCMPLDEADVRSVAARLRELGIDSVAVCFLHSYLYPDARAAGRSDPGRGAAGGDDLALERDPARAARVRADGDHGGQRVRAAADVVVPRPDPHGARRDRAGRRTALDHAVVRRRDDVATTRGGARCSRSSPGPRPASSPRWGWRSGSGSRTRSRSTWAARPPRRR